MMRAIVQHAYGTSDVLELQHIAEPTPGPHDVLVGVQAASVNRGDWFAISGRPYVMRATLGLRRPRVAVCGRDLAGRVEAVGAAVTRFRPGDGVYAETTTGSFAELACVPERLLALKPANLTFEQAAAVPVAAVTALQGLRDVGEVQPGQAVLINGASGGVGTFAVQIAKALGADVTGVCSTRNVELVRSLGAGHVIDYTREDFTRSGQRYDMILDLAGQHPLAACRRALTRTGTLVLASGHGGPVFGPLGRHLRALAWSPFVTQRLRVHASRPSRADLDAITALIESEAVTPAIEATYALADTAQAIRHLTEQHARTKIVIAVRGRHAASQPSTKETDHASRDHQARPPSCGIVAARHPHPGGFVVRSRAARLPVGHLRGGVRLGSGHHPRMAARPGAAVVIEFLDRPGEEPRHPGVARWSRPRAPAGDGRW
jgi:NADPH:quinone reductase-like Zn-dependent oxidoreductase